jgi:iron complex outermembrane receptor protein
MNDTGSPERHVSFGTRRAGAREGSAPTDDLARRYRSEFLGEVTGLSLVRQQVFVDSETLVDAQLSYDFSHSGVASLEGVEVLFQVSNLTNEPFMSYQNDDKRQVRDYQTYGRNYMLGVHYNF